MIGKKILLTAFTNVLFGLFLWTLAAEAAPSKIPGGVTSRIKKINSYLDMTENRLSSGSVSRNDLDRAKEDLETIKKSYPDFASHPDVSAAEKRISQTENALIKAETAKEQKKANAVSFAADQEKIYIDWADRLSEYKTDATPDSKGNFGVPCENIEILLANNKNYEDAKSLYAEFLKTGIDKDLHFKLRQAEYDIKVAILNYESSRARIPDQANEKMNEALQWMNNNKAQGKIMALDKYQKSTLDLLIENSNKLFPGTDRIKDLNSRKAELDRLNEEADKTILENRTMKPSQYKGSDSEELIRMAKSLVLKDNSDAQILKINITSRDWIRESAVEWTDTTKTSLQHRITDGLYAQVSAKQGTECWLFTLFLNRDEIAGKKNPLTGHIMYKERILEKNLN